MSRKLSYLLLLLVLANNCFSQQEIIKIIKPSSWKAKPIVLGKSIFPGYVGEKYKISYLSPKLRKGLILYDSNHNKKLAPFNLEIEANEDITVYAFMKKNTSKWSKWPKSAEQIRWQKRKTMDNEHSAVTSNPVNFNYKKFPKGKIFLNYTPNNKPGTKPFFIITSKTLLLKKYNSAMDVPCLRSKLKLIKLSKNDNKITVDGMLNDDEWKNASKINLFLSVKTRNLSNLSDELPVEKTDVLLLRTKKYIYIGAKCYKNNMDAILANIKHKSRHLWKDESFEIYIETPPKSRKFSQIIVNSLGHYCIGGKYSPIDEDAKLEIETQKTKTYWGLEMKIPLDLLPPGELMRVNFTRTTYKHNELAERTGWSTDRWDEIDKYGFLFLAGNNDKYNRSLIKNLENSYTENIKRRHPSYNDIEEAPYNYFMLWPEPKFIKKFNEIIRLEDFRLIDLAKAPNTTSLLEEELKRQYGIKLNSQAKYPLHIVPLDSKVTQNILSQHNLGEVLNKKYPDAFIIIIEKDKILITANNNRGIYYAVRAFLNIVSHSTKPGDEPSAQCMDIADWPDQKMRLYHWRMDTMGFDGAPEDINMFKKYIKNVIAGTRYNGIIFMMRCGIRYKSHPEIAMPFALTTEEFKNLVAFCRKHYLDPIPGMNTPGHAQWIVKRGSQKYHKLAEINDATICTRNPASLKVIFDIATELIELCGGIGKVKYFHVGKDEIRWERFDKNHKRVRDKCPYCNGVAWKDLLLEYIKREHEFFSKRGIRMIMWSDMFDKERNGRHYDTYKIIKDLPRDIILSPWSSLGYPSLGKWGKMGFDVIKGATGYKVVSVYDDITLGHMFFNCNRDNWMTFHWQKHKYRHYYNHLFTYLYGRNSWNNDPTQKPENEAEWRNLSKTAQTRNEAKILKFLYKYGNAMNYYYTKKRFPGEIDKFETIDISTYCNKKLSNSFNAGCMNDLSGLKAGEQEIAGIPTKIGHKLLLLDKNNVKDIKISKKASSILFLYTAYLAPKKENAFRRRIKKNSKFHISTKRSPIAYYLIKYADGSMEKLFMNYGFNVGPLRPPLYSRYTYDIRYVFRAAKEDEDWPEVASCREIIRGAPAVYQFEWINPHPKKEITSIDFISLNTEVLPSLIALTLRKIK